jgi:hypothetical protein
VKDKEKEACEAKSVTNAHRGFYCLKKLAKSGQEAYKVCMKDKSDEQECGKHTAFNLQVQECQKETEDIFQTGYWSEKLREKAEAKEEE